MAEPEKHRWGGDIGDRTVYAWAPVPSRTVPSLHASRGWFWSRRLARLRPSSVGMVKVFVLGKRWLGIRRMKEWKVSEGVRVGHSSGSGGGVSRVNGRYKGKYDCRRVDER